MFYYDVFDSDDFEFMHIFHPELKSCEEPQDSEIFKIDEEPNLLQMICNEVIEEENEFDRICTGGVL